MKNINKMEVVMARMIEILDANGDNNWASALEKLRKQMAVDPSFVSAQIRGMYGGMGSLNDVVLYKNGQPLVMENNEFDDLRTELYGLCHKISYGQK